MTTAVTTSTVRIPVHGSDEFDPTAGTNDTDHVVGNLYLPQQTPVGFLTLHPATATPARFYSAFAKYAAARGLAVLTYDLRGVGASGSPKTHRRLRMRDWMAQEAGSTAAWVRHEFPDLPKVALGHSLGGHALLLGHGTEELHAIVTVASHQASTRDITPIGERLRVALLLNAVGPVLSRAIGYMPGKRLGLGEDIPTAAMLEWGKWARMSEYFFSDASMRAGALTARLQVPVMAVGASDDLWASPGQVDALTDHLQRAPLERRTFTPEDVGAAKIGHHGLLRRSIGTPAWPEIVAWLLAKLPQD